jgi:hypothetical protein
MCFASVFERSTLWRAHQLNQVQIEDSGTEPRRRASFCFFGFFLPIPGRSVRFEGMEQPARGCGNFIDSRQERCLISFRGFIEAADLPDKLKRSRPNLIVGNRRREIEEHFDVSAHVE